MTDRRHFVTVFLVAVVIASCVEPMAEQTTSNVVIEIEVAGGQRWSASTDPGDFCERGSHRSVGYRTLQGSPIAYEEAGIMLQSQPEQLLIETQLGCSDGTGAISIAWKPSEGRDWIVVGGIGAYATATGGGTIEVGDDGPGGSDVLIGEISMG